MLRFAPSCLKLNNTQFVTRTHVPAMALCQFGLCNMRAQPQTPTQSRTQTKTLSTLSRYPSHNPSYHPRTATTRATTATTTVRHITYAEAKGDVQDSIHEFVVKDANGHDVAMKDLIKKVTLIVNVDCKVGELTNMECKDLQDVYSRHSGRGLEIVAFPSSQFQIISEQGSNLTGAQVKEDLQRRYHVTFPVMEKINVNGNDAHPLFMYLQKKLSGFPVNVIKWDYTVFLCVDGHPRKRYNPMASVQTIESDICEILKCHEETHHDTHNTTNTSSGTGKSHSAKYTATTHSSSTDSSPQAQASARMQSTGGVQGPEPDFNAKQHSKQAMAEPSLNVRSDDYRKGGETRPSDEMRANKTTPEDYVQSDPDNVKKRKEKVQSGNL